MENEKSKQIRFSPKFFIDNNKAFENKQSPIIKPILKPILSKIQYNEPSEKSSEKEIIWVRLYEYDDYEVSNFGVIRSIERSKYNSVGTLCNYPSVEITPRKTKKNPNLFIEIHLGVDDNGNKLRKTIYLQRAVGDHFVPKPNINTELYLFTSHINDDYNDNSYHNIKWVTKEELSIMEQQTKFDKGKIKRSIKLKIK